VSHFPRDGAQQNYGPPMPVPDYGYSPWVTDEPDRDEADDQAAAPMPPAPYGPPAYGLPATEPAVHAPVFQLAAPGEAAFQLASPGQSVDAPVAPGLPSQSAPSWQPAPMSGYQPSAYAQSYQAPPYIASYYAAPKSSGRVYWLAALGLVLTLLVSGGMYLLTRSHRPKVDLSKISLPASLTAPPTFPAAGQANLGGGVYTSQAGHFSARFSSVSSVETETQNGGDSGVSYTATVAADPTTASIVEGADLSRAITKAEESEFLHGAIFGAASGDGATVSDQHAITFQGHKAVQASMVMHGIQVTVVGVIWGPRRFYMLFAPAGPTFTDLESSFVALP